MGENKKFKKQISGHEKQISIHHGKIESELKKQVPNYERIGHWETEIKTLKENIDKLIRKLEK